MDLIRLFKSGKLNEITRQVTRQVRIAAKEKQASIYYKLGMHWIREDAQGNKFIVVRDEKGEKKEIPYK